jgi:hypothetical protein
MMLAVILGGQHYSLCNAVKLRVSSLANAEHDEHGNAEKDEKSDVQGDFGNSDEVSVGPLKVEVNDASVGNHFLINRCKDKEETPDQGCHINPEIDTVKDSMSAIKDGANFCIRSETFVSECVNGRGFDSVNGFQQSCLKSNYGEETGTVNLYSNRFPIDNGLVDEKLVSGEADIMTNTEVSNSWVSVEKLEAVSDSNFSVKTLRAIRENEGGIQAHGNHVFNPETKIGKVDANDGDISVELKGSSDVIEI